MNNYGDCESMVVDIDLEAANAELVRLNDGTPDCSLIPPAGGCESTFTETNGGAALHVEITGCRIEDYSDLFECGFKNPDAMAIGQNTDADCECDQEPICRFNSRCLERPQLCVAEDPLLGCEDCFNELDDDADGQIDCDDRFCDAQCGAGSSTITCPPSSSSTTTTTLPGDPFTVRFSLDSASAPIDAMEWIMDYSAATGEFVGSGEDVECVNLLNGAVVGASDLDGIRDVQFGVFAPTSIVAPTDLIECTFVSPGPIEPDDFVVIYDTAIDSDGKDANVSISVTLQTP